MKVQWQVITAAHAPGQVTAEVVHEALIRNWPALVEWVNRDRAFISWVRQLKVHLDEWRAHPSDEGTLLRGAPLVLAEEWAAQREDELSFDERDFIAASLARRDAEKHWVQEELHREQTRNIELQHQRANYLGALAATELARGDLNSALRFAMKGAQDDLALGSAIVASPSTATLAAVVWQSEWRLGFRASDQVLTSVAFSSDGTRIVTASSDGIVRLWDANTAMEVAVLRGHEGPVWSAAFSSDGTWILTAANDETARVWDVRTGKEIVVLRGHEGAVWSAAFSSDATRIVTASEDRTARVWDAKTAKEIAVLHGHDRAVIQRHVRGPMGRSS